MVWVSATAHMRGGRAAQPPDTTLLAALCLRFAPATLPSTPPPSTSSPQSLLLQTTKPETLPPGGHPMRGIVFRAGKLHTLPVPPHQLLSAGDSLTSSSHRSQPPSAHWSHRFLYHAGKDRQDRIARVSAAAHVRGGRAAQPPDITPVTALRWRFASPRLPSTSTPPSPR